MNRASTTLCEIGGIVVHIRVYSMHKNKDNVCHMQQFGLFLQINVLAWIYASQFFCIVKIWPTSGGAGEKQCL